MTTGIPVIYINGVRLTTSQALTIHCAIENLAMQLSAEGLGTDAHGVEMTASYLHNIAQIRRIIQTP